MVEFGTALVTGIRFLNCSNGTIAINHNLKVQQCGLGFI